MKRLSLLVALLLVAGCIVRTHPARPVYLPPPPPANRPPPPPPPAPGPQAMTYDEAVSLGRQYCANRGYACDLKEAHMTGNGVWKVKFEVEGGLKGHVHLEYNAYTRGLIKSDEKVKERHGHGKGHDHDDD